MKTIENHFWNKTTYIISKLIVNGYQFFPIDRLDAVFQIFNVPEKMKNQVMELYYENGDVENWEELAKNEDWIIREAVAKQGYGLDILINDRDSLVRLEVARQGYGLDKLINDEIFHVREIAAEKLRELQNQKKIVKNNSLNI
jgi:hypothetical protein